MPAVARSREREWGRFLSDRPYPSLGSGLLALLLVMGASDARAADPAPGPDIDELLSLPPDELPPPTTPAHFMLTGDTVVKLVSHGLYGDTVLWPTLSRSSQKGRLVRTTVYGHNVYGNPARYILMDGFEIAPDGAVLWVLTTVTGRDPAAIDPPVQLIAPTVRPEMLQNIEFPSGAKASHCIEVVFADDPSSRVFCQGLGFVGSRNLKDESWQIELVSVSPRR